MCYSAMVVQDAKRLAREFDAKVLVEMYASLFEHRLNGEKLVLNKAMEIPFLKSASSMSEKSIAKSIRQWHQNEILRLRSEIEKQTDRLKKAEASLKVKQSKKATEDVRIASNKIAKSELDLKKHESEKIESESDERIYPKNYVSILCVNSDQERVIMPIRYHMRPHNQDESFDLTHDGCYNARFNNLTLVPFWRDSLEKGRRGVMVIRKFYENVAAENFLQNKKLPANLVGRENLVVRFEPRGVEEMYVPVLWDCWKKNGTILYSGALITDDPPKEVREAGHERCPIFLEKSAIDDWLYTDLKSGKEIKEKILSRRETPFYEHKILGVA